MVAADKRGEQPLQMRFVDGDHMIQQFAPAGSHPSLGDAILPETTVPTHSVPLTLLASFTVPRGRTAADVCFRRRSRRRIQNLLDFFPQPTVCRIILHTLVPIQMGLETGLLEREGIHPIHQTGVH